MRKALATSGLCLLLTSCGGPDHTPRPRPSIPASPTGNAGTGAAGAVTTAGTGAPGGIVGGPGPGGVAGIAGAAMAGTSVTGQAGTAGGVAGSGVGGAAVGGLGGAVVGGMGGLGAGGMAGLGAGGVMPPVMTGPPASGIELVKLDANQAVAVPLFRAGKVTTKMQRKAVIVAGRGMLVRAYWKLGAGWMPRMIKGVLTVKYMDGSMKQVVDDKQVAGKGDPKKMEGAFNFRLAKADVREGMEFQVELFENGPPMGAPPASPPRIPATGTLPVHADATPSALVGVIVPFLGPKGEKPAPSATPEQLDRLSQFLYDIYPVQSVKLEALPPIAPTSMQGSAPASSSGRAHWYYALHKLCTKEGRGPGVLYQGIVNQKIKSIGVSGSAVGRGSPIDPSQPCRRKTVIAVNYTSSSRGFFKNQADGKPSTSAHEYGHVLERPHSPGCGASGADTKYPHGEGLLGAQGFRMSTDEFFHSPMHKDVMTYCYCTKPECGTTPRWISDYVYNSIHNTTIKMTKFHGVVPRLVGRSVVGFIEPGFDGIWVNTPGQQADDDDVAMPTEYAMIWVHGQPSPPLPLTVDRESHGDSAQVAFNLPPGPEPEYAVVVVDGIMRPVDMRFIDRD